MDAVFGCPVELVARPDVEEVVPGIGVHHHAVDALALQAVRILALQAPVRAHGALQSVWRTVAGLPQMGVGQIEPLLLQAHLAAGEALPLQVIDVGLKGYLESAQVGDVLAQCHRAVVADAGQCAGHHLKGAVAVGEPFRELLELLLVCRVDEISKNSESAKGRAQKKLPIAVGSFSCIAD